MGARVIFHALLELCRHNCKGAPPPPPPLPRFPSPATESASVIFMTFVRRSFVRPASVPTAARSGEGPGETRMSSHLCRGHMGTLLLMVRHRVVGDTLQHCEQQWCPSPSIRSLGLLCVAGNDGFADGGVRRARGGAGVVEEAVLLGAPVSIRGERWTMVSLRPSELHVLYILQHAPFHVFQQSEDQSQIGQPASTIGLLAVWWVVLQR